MIVLAGAAAAGVAAPAGLGPWGAGGVLAAAGTGVVFAGAGTGDGAATGVAEATGRVRLAGMTST